MSLRVPVSLVAAAVGGQLHGDPDVEVTGIAGLAEAKVGDLSFLANPKYAPHLATTQAAAVLVAQATEGIKTVQIVVANPDFAFAQLVARFGPKPLHPPVGIHPTAVIGDQVRLGKDVAIGPYVIIGAGASLGDGCILYGHTSVGGEAQLGEGCILFSHSSVRERCRLGNRVILQPGAVVGSDGFGYALLDGKHQKIPQVGIVVVEDDVEIGANSTIDRARFGRTRIGSGTKIDNLVQVAHNVEIGAHCILVAQVGIAGSTKLGNYVTLGGQAGITGHITIGDQASVTAQSGVSKSVPPKTVVRGSPAQEIRIAQAQEVNVRRLGGALQTVRSLEARIADLEAKMQKVERPEAQK